MSLIQTEQGQYFSDADYQLLMKILCSMTCPITALKSINMEKNRIVFADYLRVVACFLVMLVHSSENFYAADSSGLACNVSMLANEANRFWVAFYDGGVARTCVPLFIILSCFLLVPKKSDVSMLEFYKKRFLRILPPTLIFTLLYCFLPLAWGGMSIEQSWADFKNIPFNFPSMAGHLWFMFPLISLYLIIPVVSPWLEKASAKDERIFLGLFALSTLMPWIRHFITPEIWGECFWNRFNALWYCSGYLGYLVLAHYIKVHLDWGMRKRLTVGTVCFAVGAAFTAWSFWWKGVPGQVIETPSLEWSFEFCTPNVLVATFGLFIVFSCMRKTEAPAIVTSLSKLSFGMYLMHMFFLANIANWIIGGDPANPLIPVWAAIPVIAILSFVCCAVTSKLISLLPGSKWIIGA